ncbi:MAG: PIN domain-containing protein [Leptospiraceae bacterium]|nr:PIN domain-containing protein [Leptospiraceae bacterium]MBK8394893.1 PIN domain-containing protein [Leptospiraceae bacterium]
MRIIVDTNIWIDFLAGKEEVRELKSLVSDLKVLRHIWVESELRVASIPKPEVFFGYYKQIPETIFVNYEILFQFIQKEKLTGKGLSFIDIGLYASAKMGGHLIWTNDRNLKKFCEIKKVSYKG